MKNVDKILKAKVEKLSSIIVDVVKDIDKSDNSKYSNLKAALMKAGADVSKKLDIALRLKDENVGSAINNKHPLQENYEKMFGEISKK
jgi:hypothetical protein